MYNQWNDLTRTGQEAFEFLSKSDKCTVGFTKMSNETDKNIY